MHMKSATRFLILILCTSALQNIAYAYSIDYHIKFVTEEIPDSSPANMELVLNDFFNLLLTTEERDIVRTEVLKNIKITGYYKGTKEVKGVTYEVYRKPRSSSHLPIDIPDFRKFKRELNLRIEAKIKDVSVEESKVIFALPVKTGKRDVFELYAVDIGGSLEHLADKYPKTNLDFKSIPRYHDTFSGHMRHRHHFTIDVVPADKTVSGQNYRVDKYYPPSLKGDNFPINGWVVQLNALGDPRSGAAQVKAPAISSNKFSKDNLYFYYDTSKVTPYDEGRDNSYSLSLPPDEILPPIWQGLDSVFFDFNIHKTFDESYHKEENKLVEVLVMKAEIPYMTEYGWMARTEGKAEKWTKVRGRLVGINGGAVPNDSYDDKPYCHNFKYKIIYAPDDGEYKFFSHRYSKGDVQILNNDVTQLQAFRAEFEKVYADKEKDGEYLKVCQRRVDDAIYVLTAPKEKLEKEFEFYENLIKKGKR